MNTRVFQKGHKKRAPQHATVGYLGRSYPEGGPKKSSLGGPFRHLKFGKNQCGGSRIGSDIFITNDTDVNTLGTFNT